jgi:L-rhamnose-H+ transport protein
MNPLLGVVFHWLGGLASGSFYAAFRPVKRWSWETFWLVGGFFSWIIVPWLLASVMTRDLIQVLQQTSSPTLFWTWFFGLLWGFGGLTFGLTMRYLGMSLGMATALGYTAAFGTLVPPLVRHQVIPGVILAGIAICLCGIALAGAAGLSKEREMSEAQKRVAIKEFDLKKGLVIATFCGIMSACFSFGLAAGDPIKELTLIHGTPYLWQGLPVLVVVLLGGFTTNFVWCVILHLRNNSGGEYLDRRFPMLNNYFFSALAGTIWYMQFFFYTMGETQMGVYKFSSWSLHMASIIIFSMLWGIALKEWKGTGRRTQVLVALSLVVLVASTAVIGYGNYLGSKPAVAASK